MNAVIIGLIFIIILVLLWMWTHHHQSKIMYQATPDSVGPQIISNEFSDKYRPNVWGPWKGNAMPWSNCIDPYNPDQCLPYCKRVPVMNPLGTITYPCVPKCGTACNVDSECPIGCPNCIKGVCQA